MCRFIGYIANRNLDNEVIINNKFDYHFEKSKNTTVTFSYK